MRGAARQPKEEPAPERADLDAKAAKVLDGQAELVARATAMLDRCPDQALLRQFITEAVAWGLHCEEMREELARYTTANAGGDSFFAMGRAYERSLQDAAAKAAVPGQHRRDRKRAPGLGQLALVVMDKARALVLPAAVASWAVLKPLGKHAGHAVAHPAALKLTAYHLKLAAVVTASTATLAIGGAVVITHYDGSQGSGQVGSGTGAASVPGWHTSASPFPSSSPVALLTKPKSKRGSKKQLLSASGLPLPCCAVGPQPSASASASPSSAAPSVQASVQVGPATLSVSTTALDLTSLTSETITLSATGAGFVSWKISTTGVDLDFSTPDGGDTHGVLKAGDSVVVTVTLAGSLDSLTQQAFTVVSGSSPDGWQVTVSLPLPVPLPSVSVPAPVTSLLPSSAASLLG